MFRILPGRVAVVVFSVAVSGCGGGADTGVAVSDSAGVYIVESLGPDRQLDRRVVELTRLMPPDSALSAFPWGVAADPMTGRIYVADRTSPRVVAFDRDGGYLGTYGREGRGPGEFVNVSAVSVTPHGALTAWDTGRGILSRWSSEGDLLNERRPPVSHWGPGVYDAGDRLVTVTLETSGSEALQALVEVTPDDTTVLHAVPREMVDADLPCMRGPVPRLFSPSVTWTARGETTFVRNGAGYRIDGYVDGDAVTSFRRPVEPARVTTAMAVERAELRFGGFLQGCGIAARQLVDAVGHLERISPVQWIAADPEGRLWISRTSDGVSTERIDVLGPGGRYEGTVETHVMPVAFVSPSRFVGVHRSEETGETLLTLHELREDARPDRRGSGSTRPAWAPEIRTDLREFRDCPECPLMIELPTGSFTMGAPDGEAPAGRDPTRPEWTERAETPQVEVTIDGRLAVGKYEVTFEEWDRCVEAGGCEHEPDDEGWGRGRRPVVHVARSDAKQYAAWLRRRTGEAYRLPSEAEWEYAARAGTETAYWWGDELGEGRIACDGCGTRWDDRSTAPVGSFPANPWGLHDMLTNAEEWVADCWHPTHEGHPGDGSARTETSEWWRDEGWEDRQGRPCRRPVERGGSFSTYPWANRAASRSYYWPNPNWHERKSATQGFRVVRTVAEAADPPPSAPDSTAG